MHNENNNDNSRYIDALTRVSGTHTRVAAAAAFVALLRGEQENYARELAVRAISAMSDFLVTSADESGGRDAREDLAVEQAQGALIGMGIVRSINSRQGWEQILGYVERDTVTLLEAAAVEQFGAHPHEAARVAARAALTTVITQGISGDDYTILPLSGADILDGMYEDLKGDGSMTWAALYGHAGAFPGSAALAPCHGWREVYVDGRRARVTFDLEKFQVYVYLDSSPHYSLCVRLDDAGAIIAEKVCSGHSEIATLALEKCVPGVRAALCL